MTKEERAAKRAQDYVDKQHDYMEEHGFQYITYDDCRHYRNLHEKNGCSQSSLKELKEQLMQTFGLLEVEAINILNGYQASWYVLKYERIRKRIPTELIRPTEDRQNSEGDETQ